jgi:hypothetical protein
MFSTFFVWESVTREKGLGAESSGDRAIKAMAAAVGSSPLRWPSHPGGRPRAAGVSFTTLQTFLT